MGFIRVVHRALVAIPLVAATAVPAVGVGLDGTDVLARFQVWLDGTRDLECRFRQSLVSGALGGGVQETGTLFLRRPGRLRWDYDPPDPKVALLLDRRTELYLPDERQLVRGTLDPERSLLPDLLAGEARLESLFDVTLVATPEVGGEGAYRIRLVPLRAEGAFEAVILTLRPPACAIEAAEVLDAAGNRTEYRFEDLRRNRGLAEGLFRFEAPPGTQIVEEEP